MNSLIFWPIPIAAIIALVFAWIFFRSMMKGEEGTDLMIRIASHVRKGAMAYLKQQYKVVAVVFLIITLVFAILSYGLGVQNGWLPAAFLMGGFFSGLAGYFGMKTATWASGRTAQAWTREGPLNLRNARHAEDPAPLDARVDCPASREFSRAYLHHLVKSREMLGATLLSWHNTAFYQALMAEIRSAIEERRFEDWRRGFEAGQTVGGG